MLYRAAGDDKEHIIRFGLATNTDGYHFERESNEPLLGQSEQGPDMGCIENTRIIKFDDYYYVTYAYRPSPPGQYWKFKHDEVLTENHGEHAPHFIKNNMANSAFAMTKYFKTWIKLGRIIDSNLDDRDVILFPEKINGKYAMLHRPKGWIDATYGVKTPAAWIRFSDDIVVWNEPSTMIIGGIDAGWEEKVGGSIHPLRTAKGWLVLYHGVEKGGLGYYRVGAVMLNLKDPTKVIGRTKDFIMEHEHAHEIKRYYKRCVFPAGNMIIDETLHAYYGGADKYIGLATFNVNALIELTLEQN